MVSSNNLLQTPEWTKRCGAENVLTWVSDCKEAERPQNIEQTTKSYSNMTALLMEVFVAINVKYPQEGDGYFLTRHLPSSIITVRGRNQVKGLSIQTN